MAYVCYCIREGPTIDSIFVVRDITYVFPTNLRSLSPEYDTDFSIDHELGTHPIFISPYHMENIEIKDLNIQF